MKNVDIRVVDPAHTEAHRIMLARHERELRIDALAVDRSHLAGIPLPRWSSEALERGETYREVERGRITLEERLDAYRGITALPKATRTG